LSNKEAQFADLLLRGLTVKEAAQKLDMTFETARWYCKQAMHKIGVNRRGQLIATLLSNVLVSVDTDVRGHEVREERAHHGAGGHLRHL
jgi:DNA-binding CsgD family transcriptional regulator